MGNRVHGLELLDRGNPQACLGRSALSFRTPMFNQTLISSQGCILIPRVTAMIADRPHCNESGASGMSPAPHHWPASALANPGIAHAPGTSLLGDGWVQALSHIIQSRSAVPSSWALARWLSREAVMAWRRGESSTCSPDAAGRRRKDAFPYGRGFMPIRVATLCRPAHTGAGQWASGSGSLIAHESTYGRVLGAEIVVEQFDDRPGAV